YFSIFPLLCCYVCYVVYTFFPYTMLFRSFGNSNYYLVRQLIVVFISLFIAFFVYIFPFRVLKKKKTILFGTVVIFALLTIVFFLPARLGARRWIPLPVFNLQPAEFAKVFVIWYLAYIFSRNQKELESEFLQTIMKPSI